MFVIEWSKYLHLQNVLFDEMTVPCPDEGVEGTFWRVPVAEGAIRLAGKPRAIQTDYNGNGITQGDRDMIDLQILASEKAHRIPQNDYKVIFYPSKFRLRLVAFTIVIWVAIFGTIWTCLTLPIRIGRLIFRITLNITDIHDAYSWIAGLYLIWFAMFIKYVVGREQRRWSKYFSLRPRSHFPVKYFVIHTFTIIGRLAFAVSMLIFVIPLLVGLLFEVYMVLPLSYHLYPNTTPVLRIADAWAAGMILCAIALQSARLVPAQQLPNFIDRVFISQCLIPTRLFHSSGIENVIRE
jgi:E3 ubiquitin-protein ligase MARCH6